MNVLTLDAQKIDPKDLIDSLKNTGLAILTNHGVNSLMPNLQLMSQLEMLGMATLFLLAKPLAKDGVVPNLVGMIYQSPKTFLKVSQCASDIGADAAKSLCTLSLMPFGHTLEVKDDYNNWYTVDCDSESVIVSVGSPLLEFSNNYYRAAAYRISGSLVEGDGKYLTSLFINPREKNT